MCKASRGAEAFFFTFLFSWCGPKAGPALQLVKSGKTEYAIYHGASAPQTVKLAAEEMQRVIKLSTGVQLPIKNESAIPMISLGNNAEAEKAGLSTQSLPDDGFIIVTKAKNLYILGKDTSDDKPTWWAWASRGTLCGVYDFLERVVGVRWLLPEEWGEDIPRHTSITVPEMSVKESPDFPIRALVDIQERRPSGDKRPSEPKLWLLRQKIPPTTEGRKLEHGHAWDAYVAPEALQVHPEYLAVSEDNKPRHFSSPALAKFCTTNQELVSLFAQGVVKWLEDHPNRRSASISPSDGGDFCQCANCRALVTKDPHGNPSYTPVLLGFFNNVARIVGQKHPDRLLGAYVYNNYMYPPDEPIKMQPNLYLVWAPLNYYGWGLAKPVYREEFKEVITGWTALTRNFVYHNYSTWMRSFNGAPVPPGLDILKLELPTLHRCGVKGAEMVGLGAWGYGGPGNYILAKQMWDAEVNVDTLYREWLQRAYGPGWHAMERLYLLLEARMKERKEKEAIKYTGDNYEVNYDLIEKVHLPIFPEMERLYLDAMSKVSTEGQRRRLEMFGENLIMLHYNMRKAGMLTDPERSAFYRSDEAYRKFLEDTEFSLALYRDHGKRYTGPIWKGQWSGD